jgi:signal transduction histidine kinase/ActR/RegA family two-component response regulator
VASLRTSLRTYLIASVTAVVLPVLAFAAYLGAVAAHEQRVAIENGMRETARALSLAADRQVGVAIAALEALVSSAAFQRGESRTFRGEADAFLSHYEGWLSVVDEDGQQLLNTRYAPGSVLPRIENAEWLRNAFAAQPIYISGAITGPGVKETFVAISRKAQMPGRKPVVLTLSISPQSLSRLLLEQSLPQGWFGVITDRAGLLIGRTQSLELVGLPLTLKPTPPSGFAKMITREGAATYLAWSVSPISGWAIGVAAPAGVIDAITWWAVARIAMLGLGALAIALAAALYFGRRVTDPLTAMARAIEGTRGTEQPQLPHATCGIIEIDALASAFRAKVKELTEAVAGRDAAQHDLKSLNDELEERIRNRSLELERLNELLVETQRQESLGRLSGGIAHDFNNLLAAILGNLELLKRRAKDLDLTRYIDNARAAAERGAQMVNQLLAFARNQRLEPKAVAVNAAMQRIAELLRGTMGDAIRIDLALSQDALHAMADPSQLDLIMLNLAVNARDAMPMGGTLTIATSAEHFGRKERPEEPPPGDYIVIAVSDTGTGMTDAVRDRVFEPFFSTKEVGKGSGLGLPHVLGVLKQLGGGIRVRSRPGEGTRVELFLPRAAVTPAAGEAPVAAVAATERLGSLTVLLTDDDPDVRAATAGMLRELGCEVIEAGSGAASLDLVASEKRHIDLAIVDYAMPGLNGAETARQLAEARPGLRAVLISGYADADKLAAEWQGSVLRKPFGLAELAALLAQHIEPAENVIPFPSAVPGHGAS